MVDIENGLYSTVVMEREDINNSWVILTISVSGKGVYVEFTTFIFMGAT